MPSDPFQFSQFWCGSLGAPLSQPEVRRWVQSNAPECCHGALSSRDVATAWSVLAEAVEQKQIIASLDFEKCFDHVFPPLAVGTLRSK